MEWNFLVFVDTRFGTVYRNWASVKQYYYITTVVNGHFVGDCQSIPYNLTLICVDGGVIGRIY